MTTIATAPRPGGVSSYRQRGHFTVAGIGLRARHGCRGFAGLDDARVAVLERYPKLRDGRTALSRCFSKKMWLMAKYLILARHTNLRYVRNHVQTAAVGFA